MVRAILEGRKTQTRRVVKNPDYLGCLTGDCSHEKQAECNYDLADECPYGQPGDRLWVRETFADVRGMGFDEPNGCGRYFMEYAYRSDCEPNGLAMAKAYGVKWKPSIHMPRVRSRITLEVTGVRVERLREIGAGDIISEGIIQTLGSGVTPFGAFANLWDSINLKRSYGFNSNPWVWVIEFRRISADPS